MEKFFPSQNKKKNQNNKIRYESYSSPPSPQKPH